MLAEGREAWRQFIALARVLLAFWKPPHQVITHAGIRPFVPSRHQFLMEANHIVAPRLPALKQIGQIGIEAAHIGTACGLGIGSSSQPIADGTLTNAYAPGNRSLAHPQFAQSHHLLITGQAFLSIGEFATRHFGGMSEGPGRLFDGKVVER